VILVPALVWARRRGPAVVAGFAAMHVPVALHYAAHGQLAALVGGYAFNPWGLAYITQRGAAGPLAELWEGALATVHTLALPLALAGFAGVRRLALADRSHRDRTRRTGWTGWSCGWSRRWRRRASGCGSIAATTWRCCRRCACWRPRRGACGRCWVRPIARLRAGVAALLIAVLAARAAVDLAGIRGDRRRSHDAGARAVARYVQQHSREGDTIWVWGWHLWGVHALTGRMSGSRVYKTLGLLTPPNDDTWRRAATPPRVDPRSPWMAVLLADLERTRPAVIVLGGTTPRSGIDGLRGLLRAGYRRDDCKIGKVECWRRVPVDPNAGLR
jgi:hypothetical protein